MWKTRWFQAILFLSFGFAACYFSRAPIESIQKITVQSGAYDIVKRQETAWNEGDLDGFLREYAMSEDITFYSDDRISQGWVELNDRYRRRYSSDKSSMGKLAFSDLISNALSTDAVMVRGRWTLTETPNAGTGLFTILLRKTDNGWKIVHDHTSAKAKN